MPQVEHEQSALSRIPSLPLDLKLIAPQHHTHALTHIHTRSMHSCTHAHTHSTSAHPRSRVSAFCCSRRGAGVTSSMPIEKPRSPIQRADRRARRFMHSAAMVGE